jgi:N4-gp56 family major capsid protein
MPTEVPAGSNLAVKLFSVALFGEQWRRSTFRRNMTGPAPKQADAERNAKGQTDPGFPFVTITDLSKGPGEEVTMDLFHRIKGKPVMGDRKLAGRLMKLTSSSMSMKINQCRGGVETGGQMSQKRTAHNLRTIAKANLAGWNASLYDQLAQVHVSGARGYQDDEEWVVPLDSDPDTVDILVNPVLPPTRNRRRFAGDATSVSNIDATDVMTLTELDKIRAVIDDMPMPMQSCKLVDGGGTEDPEADEEPMYVLWVTGRVWYQLETQTTGQAWRTFLQNAWNRANNKGWKGHPLFNGQPGMWNGILVKKMRRAIRFPAGSTVVEYDANNAPQNVTVGAVSVDRCILLGAQALGIAFGRHNQSGYHFSWHEETTDHDNIKEISTASMGGMAKIRFTGSDGAPTDFGVMTIDVAAPAIT